MLSCILDGVMQNGQRCKLRCSRGAAQLPLGGRVARAVALVLAMVWSLPAANAPACDPDNGGIQLPPGFCALVVADGIGTARHIAAAPNGDIYVALQENGK
jgi:hypothetical protein